MTLSSLLVVWPWRPLTLLALVGVLLLYIHGWRRLHRALPDLASPARLLAFVGGLIALALAILSPLYALRHDFLAARAVQQVLLGMFAPPLLWLACPFHVLLWGAPRAVRDGVTRHLLRPSRVRRAAHVATLPIFTWLTMMSAFLIWHDPAFARWTLGNEWRYSGALALLFSAYLLFWWHLVGTAPRLHRTLSAWGAFAYLVLGAEIPNMLAGVTIAYTAQPIYPHFGSSQTSTALGISDQIMSGGIIWVVGSLVYVSSAIIVVNRLFKREEIPPPRLPVERFATDRTIAPGLEQRVIQEHWRQLREEQSKTR